MAYNTKPFIFKRLDNQKEYLREKLSKESHTCRYQHYTISIKYNSFRTKYYVVNNKSFFNFNALASYIIG